MLQTFKPCGMGRVLPMRQPTCTGTIAARRMRCNGGCSLNHENEAHETVQPKESNLCETQLGLITAGSAQPASTAAATTAPAAPAPVEQAVAAMDAAADSTAMYTPPPMDPRMYQVMKQRCNSDEMSHTETFSESSRLSSVCVISSGASV